MKHWGHYVTHYRTARVADKLGGATNWGRSGEVLEIPEGEDLLGACERLPYSLRILPPYRNKETLEFRSQLAAEVRRLRREGALPPRPAKPWWWLDWSEGKGS